MGSPLDDSMIADLLAEEAAKPKGGGGGRTKADPTEPREVNVWFKLPHHLCTSDCEHRTNENKQSREEKACWNPECADPRSEDDRGANVVAEIKGQWVCRYCFLAGYLSTSVEGS